MGLAYIGLTHCDRCGNPLKDNEFVTCRLCKDRKRRENNYVSNDYNFNCSNNDMDKYKNV